MKQSLTLKKKNEIVIKLIFTLKLQLSKNYLKLKMTADLMIKLSSMCEKETKLK